MLSICVAGYFNLYLYRIFSILYLCLIRDVNYLFVLIVVAEMYLYFVMGFFRDFPMGFPLFFSPVECGLLNLLAPALCVYMCMVISVLCVGVTLHYCCGWCEPQGKEGRNEAVGI